MPSYPTYTVSYRGPMPAAMWASQNPVLAQFERGRESDTGKEKEGPGAWNDLGYLNPSGAATVPVKATGAEVNTGTDDAKFVTAKAIEDSDYAKTAAITSAVNAAVAALLDGAPGALDTLNELAAALADDAAFSTTVTNALSARLVAANNLSDVPNPAAARIALEVPTILSAVLQADFPKTNDTLANVTGLTLTLEAGKWYRITGRVNWSADDSVGGKIDFAGGSATATGVSGLAQANDSATANNAILIDALTSTIGVASFPAAVYFDFTIQVDAGGTFIPRFAQNTTDAAASNLLKYSTINAQDVTPPA